MCPAFGRFISTNYPSKVAPISLCRRMEQPTHRSSMLNVQVRDLTLDQELSGEVDLQATTQDGQLVLSGHSELLKGTLTVEGTVGMHGDFPANIAAHTDHVDLDALWRAYLGDQLTGHSSVTGVMTMQGPAPLSAAVEVGRTGVRSVDRCRIREAAQPGSGKFHLCGSNPAHQRNTPRRRWYGHHRPWLDLLRRGPPSRLCRRWSC